MIRQVGDKIVWVGVYHIGDDSFTVWKALGRDKSGGTGIIHFYEKESQAIERMASGKCFLKWNPPDADLSTNSRAYWARM